MVAVLKGLLSRRCGCVALLWGVLVAFIAPARGNVTAYNSQASFLAAAGNALTLDFESVPKGTAVTGSTVSGFTFSSNLSDGAGGTLSLGVDDAYATTSGTHYLSDIDPNNYNLLISGDTDTQGDGFTATFAPTHAFGLYFIASTGGTAPAATTFSIVTGTNETASNSATPAFAPDAGTEAYFVGLVDSAATFSSVDITTPANANNDSSPYYFYVDDLTRGVPEPGSGCIFFGLGLTIFSRRRSRPQPNDATARVLSGGVHEPGVQYRSWSRS